MKLDSKTVAALTLAGKKDAIFFDDVVKGFGFRLRAGAGGKTLRTWIAQYRRAGATRRMLIGSAEVLPVHEAVIRGIRLGEHRKSPRLGMPRKFATIDDDAAQCRAVTAHELRQRMHDDIGAIINWS